MAEAGLAHATEATIQQAVRLVARVEQESGVLRDLSPSQRRFRVHGAVAIADGSAQVQGLPLELRAAGSLLEGSLPPIRAELLRLGRPDYIFRVRAFYPDAGATLAIHDNIRPWPLRSRLHRGFRALQRLQDAGGFVVPRALESGRRLRHAWVVESLLRGQPITREQWPSFVPQVLESLTSMWRGTDIELQPVAGLLPSNARRHVRDLLGDADDRLDIDPADLDRRVGKLLSGAGEVLFGWCHGDTARANILRTEDGRLGLVDWEMAGRRPLGFDASRVLLGLDDPLAFLDRTADGMEQLADDRAAPWRDQLAVGCLIRLARLWKAFDRSERSKEQDFRHLVVERRRKNLHLLSRLLSAD